jgi:hypothetical protein
MDYTVVDTTICRTGIGDIRTTTPSPPPLPDVVAIVKDDSGGVVVPSPPPPPPPAFSISSNNMLVTTPSLLRRNFCGGVTVNGSSGGSPETEEFESLERRLHEELEQKLNERKLSAAMPEPLSPPAPTIGKPAPWSQPFVGDDADQLVSLQLVEKRQLRSFSRADEYLYAMKEDLGRLQFLMYIQ